MGQKSNHNNCSLDQNWVVVGKIGAPLGLHGWLKVTSFTSPSFALIDYISANVDLALAEDNISSNFSYLKHNFKLKVHAGKYLAIKLPDVNDRNSASLFTHRELAISRIALPELENEQEWYWHDLVGLDVIGFVNNTKYGTVKNLLETGSNDVLVLNNNSTIPFILDVSIKSIDLDKKIIIVIDDYVVNNK